MLHKGTKLIRTGIDPNLRMAWHRPISLRVIDVQFQFLHDNAGIRRIDASLGDTQSHVIAVPSTLTRWNGEVQSDEALSWVHFVASFASAGGLGAWREDLRILPLRIAHRNL